MPFSQTHLLAAYKLLNDAQYDWIQDDKAVAAFLFGSVAPDTRVVSGQSRESTHFFTIPPQSNSFSPSTMLAAWHELADPAALRADHAALIAGYLTHLVMDEVWVEDVVLPCLFIEGEPWGPQHQNWHIYNATIAYLDYKAARQLPAEIVAQVGGANIVDTLPFIDNDPMFTWRTHVSERIASNQFRSIEFAARNCDIPEEEMRSLVTSEENMAREVYPIVPPDNIAAFQRDTAERMQQVVEDYFNRLFLPESKSM